MDPSLASLLSNAFMQHMLTQNYAQPPQPVYQGMTAPGNIDLNTRPQVRGPEGISTVRSMSYGDNAGNEVLIPTVSDEGTIMGNRDAIRYWGNKGQYLGKFRTPEDADRFAQGLHEDQAWLYGIK